MKRVHHRNGSFAKTLSVVGIERCQTSKTGVEEQLADGDDLLKRFSPLINSMRVCGLYFTRVPRCVPDVQNSRSTTVTKDSAVPMKWNGGRIYVLTILVALWLDAARKLSLFDKADKFGLVLFVKLASVSGSFLCAVLQTACFVACQTGNLDRVFREARLSKSDHVRYHRLAVIHTTACWIIIVGEVLIFLVPQFLREKHWDMSLVPFGNYIAVSDQPMLLIKLLACMFYFFEYSAWIFSQSVNYIDCSKVLQCILPGHQ